MNPEDPAKIAVLKIRSELMAVLRGYISKKKLTQKVAAQLLRVTQPRVSDLVRGKTDRFTIDSLMGMLWRAGYEVKFKIRELPEKSSSLTL